MADLYIYMHSLSLPGLRIFQLNDVKKMVEIGYPVDKEIISDSFLLTDI